VGAYRLETGWIQRLGEKFPPRSLSAYLFALGAVVVTTVARVALSWFDVTLVYVTYFPAVMLVALICGPLVATVASFMSAIAVWWFFLLPRHQFGVPTRSDIGNAILFLACCGLMIWAAELYRRAMARLRENERQRTLIMRELEHRGKNTFAVVESIVRSSLEELPDRAETIAGRIRAVSVTNDIINRSPEHRSTIKAILQREFEPHGIHRLVASGDGVELEANVARAMALVIHELVTNAVKYGALSQDGGTVSVRWRSEGRAIQIDWREQGGPPVQPPERFGFGSKLVTRTMRTLGGGVEPEFRPDGLVCRLTFSAG
jgi:two-component sensor histidine kinase